MGNPYVGVFDTPSATQTRAPSAGYSGVFDDNGVKQKQSGLLDYVGNLAKNWASQGALRSALNFLDPINQLKLSSDPETSKIVLSDLSKTFDRLFDVAGSGSPIAMAQGIGNEIARIKASGKNASLPSLGGLALGLIKPVGDLMELSSGLQLTENDVQALTPEQKAERIKSTIGLMAASAVAGPLAEGIGAQGTLAAKMLANATVGGVSGATYGLVSGAGNEDQLSEVIQNGIFGAGLGLAHGVLFGRSGSKGNVKPQEINQIRTLTSPDNSPAEIVNLSRSLATADDLASALLEGKVGLKENDIHIIPGVSPLKISSLDSKLPEGYRSALHIDDEGVGRLLVYDNKFFDSKGEQFFEKNGFVQGQIASYLGKDNWSVLDAKGKDITLENILDGSRIEANRNDVRLPSSFDINIKRADLTDRLYGEWKSSIDNPISPDVANPLAERYDPIGFDETPPSNYLDKIPELEGISALKNLDDFLAGKGFTPDELNGLKRELQIKLANEAKNQLDIGDRDIIDRGSAATNDILKSSRQSLREYNALQRIARSNGFRISEGGSGRIIIRDAEDRILAGVDNMDAAKDWINKTGQAQGTNLDSNGTVDPAIAGGNGTLPPSDPPKYPQDLEWDWFFNDKNLAKAGNRGEDFIRYLSTKPLVTRYRDFALDIDRKYGTQIGRALDNIMLKRNIRNAQVRPFVDEWERLRKTLSSKRGELIGQYMQTMTPEEVISGFMNRPMNPLEIGLSKQIADRKVDLESIFKYRRQVEKLERDYPQEIRSADPSKEVEYQQQQQAARNAYRIDDNHKQVADLLDSIEETPKDKVSGGAVVRLARALDNGVGQRELSKGEFAVKHKLSFDEIRAANQLTDLYGRLAKVFGINSDRQLGGYMTHAKLYFDGDIPKAMKHFSGDLKTKEFYAKLTRTGEVSSYEPDAFKSSLRYMKGGFDVQSGFYDALKNGRKVLQAELAKIPSNLQSQVESVISRGMNDIQGIPEAGDLAARENVDYLMDKYKLGGDDQVRRNWTNVVTSLVNAGALGGRPMLGIGHFGISNVISIAARSHAYTARMLARGASAIADHTIMEDLQAKGVFQGLSPFSAMKAADVDPYSVSGKIGNVIDKTQDALFKATLLPSVYDGLAAGHYLTTYGDALKGLTAFSRKEITGTQLTKDLFLRRYDAPVSTEFVRLAKDGKIEEAAHYLGRQAVEDLVGTYGSGNTPYKWGTNLGRIVGQFGNYAMWIRATVQRMLSRGTAADRINSVAKLAGLSALTYGASKETGIDLTRMSPLHAMTWLFGPDVHIAEDAMEAVHSNGYTQQQALRRLGRILPIDPQTGAIQPSIFIPGSMAVEGIVNAAESFNRGDIGQAALEAAGFRKYGQNKKPTL